jgi:hypothetical protein
VRRPKVPLDRKSRQRSNFGSVARLDTELEPPHRQSREPTGARRSEWRFVVGTDCLGQANFVENPLHGVPDASPRRLDNAHVQQIPARRIRKRQRIAAPTVSGTKPALEVNRPFLVRGRGRGNHLTLCNCAAPASPPQDETLVACSRPGPSTQSAGARSARQRWRISATESLSLMGASTTARSCGSGHPSPHGCAQHSVTFGWCSLGGPVGASSGLFMSAETRWRKRMLYRKASSDEARRY